MTPERAYAMSWFALCVDDPLVMAKVLRRRDYVIFAPYKTIRRRLRRGRRQSVAIDVPVIRGYVFVGVDRETEIYWPGLLNVHRVHGVVCYRGRPAIIPFRQLDRIRRRSWHSDFSGADTARLRDDEPIACQQPTALSVGDSAAILAGPFEDKAIEVSDLTHHGDRNVVQFLTHMFGREVRAEIGVDKVAVA